MKLIAIMPCRNEEWCIGLTLRAVQKWADWVVVLDHASTDSSREIIQAVDRENAGAGVTYIRDDDPTWREMAHRQRLLETARGLGATHIAYVDADEILTGDLLPTIREWCAAVPMGTMISLPWLQLCGAIDRVHTQGIWGSQSASTVFRDDPLLHWAARNGYDFHQREPLGRAWIQSYPLGRHRRPSGLMHLQFVSNRRLKAKQALYKMQEVIRWPGRKPVAEVDRMYSQTVEAHLNAKSYGIVPPTWWEPYRDLLHCLHVDAEPWQEVECRRMMEKHGAAAFAGLDLFGVV